MTLYNAVTSDDFPLLQGIFLVISFSVLFACLLADIVYFVRRPAHAGEGGVLMSALAEPLEPALGGAPELPEAVITRRRGAIRRLPGKAKVGAVILGLFVLIAVIGPTIAPFDPTASTPGQALPLGPTTTHLLGTTATGQDVLSQLLVGTRSTVVLGLLTGVIATLLAVVIGMSAGFLGGASDEGLSLLANVFLVLPALPLLVVILGYLPHSGELPTAIVLSALGWPWGARVIRAQTLSLRNRDYVAAARESGESGWRIILFEIFPNEIGLIAASFVGTVLYAILTSVALAFLGVANLSQLELRDDAVLGRERQRRAAERVVVVRAARDLRGAARDEHGPAQLRARRARQPAPAGDGQRARRAPDVAALGPDPGSPCSGSPCSGSP